MLACALSIPFPVAAEAVIATRVIKAGEVIAATDLSLVDAQIDGAIADSKAVAGKEARVSIYPGRPIRARDLGPPSVVERNQIVSLIYSSGTLTITTEGRALARGSAGDLIRVLNLSSRNSVLGQILPDGTIRVGPPKG